MKVREHLNNQWRDPAVKEYDTDLVDIEEVAMRFGITNDTVELYTDDKHLVAIATWPMGSKGYVYCDNPEADYPDRRWRR